MSAEIDNVFGGKCVAFGLVSVEETELANLSNAHECPDREEKSKASEVNISQGREVRYQWRP